MHEHSPPAEDVRCSRSPARAAGAVCPSTLAEGRHTGLPAQECCHALAASSSAPASHACGCGVAWLWHTASPLPVPCPSPPVVNLSSEPRIGKVSSQQKQGLFRLSSPIKCCTRSTPLIGEVGERMGSQDGAEGAHAAEQQAPQPDPAPAEAGPAAPDAATQEDGAAAGQGCGPC